MTDSDDNLEHTADLFNRIADMPHTRAHIAHSNDPHINGEGLTNDQHEYMLMAWAVTIGILNLAHTTRTNPDAITTFSPVLLHTDWEDEHTATFAQHAVKLQRSTIAAAIAVAADITSTTTTTHSKPSATSSPTTDPTPNHDTRTTPRQQSPTAY